MDNSGKVMNSQFVMAVPGNYASGCADVHVAMLTVNLYEGNTIGCMKGNCFRSIVSGVPVQFPLQHYAVIVELCWYNIAEVTNIFEW